MPETLHQVALFPIPNVVSFPGTTMPLHVFEPRYRTMISDCIENERMIAVSHTTREIRAAKSNQTVQDALKTNQATYESEPVFSAGYCEVVETTSDGRIYINIHMKARLKMVSEVQTLPYRIVNCTEVIDEPEPAERSRMLQRDITAKLLTIIGRQNPAQLTSFDSEKWLNLDPASYSFQVFQMLRFGPDTMQEILACTSAEKRLSIIDEILTMGLQSDE